MIGDTSEVSPTGLLLVPSGLSAGV